MTAHERMSMPVADGGDIQLLIRLIRKCVREDREDEARRILLGAGTVSFSSGAEAVAWGRLAEMLGERDLAQTAYAMALPDADAAGGALSALASMQIEAGHEGPACLLLDQEHERGIAPSLGRHIAREISLARGQEPAFTPDISADLLRRQALEKFMRLFRGRQGVYARQWYDRPKDLCGYAPIYEPFSMDVAARHLAGSLTVGLYPLSPQGTVFFAAIDIDVTKSRLPQLKSDPQYQKHLASVFTNLVVQLNQWCMPQGLEAVFEDSGHKGIHAWFFFKKPVPAGDAIALLDAAVASLKGVPPDIHCEIFPKQESLHAKKLGNLIKLPLGVHRKTGKKSRFLNSQGLPMADWQSRLLGIRFNGGPRFDGLLEELRTYRLGSKVKHLPGTSSAAPQQRTAATPVPATGPAADVIGACAMIAYLVEKAQRERHLSFTERRVLLGVLGHVSGGLDLLHRIVGMCTDYSRQITEHYISKLKGTPLGCNKIRRLLFYLNGSIPCQCVLPPCQWEYATPLAFAGPSVEARVVSAGAEVPLNELQKKIRQMEKELSVLKKSTSEALKQGLTGGCRPNTGGSLQTQDDFDGNSLYC